MRDVHRVRNHDGVSGIRSYTSRFLVSHANWKARGERVYIHTPKFQSSKVLKAHSDKDECRVYSSPR